MRRREILAGIGCAAALSRAVSAQDSGRTYRIGPVMTVPRSDISISTVLEELKSAGFVEGKNLVVDPRGLSLKTEQMATVAHELAEAKVDLLLVGGSPATRAAQAASSTVPILSISDDMVREGLVGSLANRGGNTTGISILATELDGKRQELLIELLPGARKLAMLADASLPAADRLGALQARARANGVDVAVLSVAKPEDLQPALERAKAQGASAINILASSFLFANRRQIFAAAAANRLGTMYQWAEGIQEGALAAYGPSLDQIFRQRGRQATKLLRGVKTSDLPVEQPTTIKLALNLKLARELGVAVPAQLLQRADEAIE